MFIAIAPVSFEPSHPQSRVDLGDDRLPSGSAYCSNGKIPPTRSKKGNLGLKEAKMGESVYKVIELVGTSTESWEKAAAVALETASKSLRDLRVAEVIKFDIHIQDGKPVYRTKLSVSFKYQTEPQ
jgi:hypothetical protein